MSLPHFWITFWRKRLRFEHMQTVIHTSRRLSAFLHEAAQNLELFIKYSGSKIKNKKPLAVDVVFRAYPMVPHSYRSNLAVRYL
jgi:hypothetical protein